MDSKKEVVEKTQWEKGGTVESVLTLDNNSKILLSSSL